MRSTSTLIATVVLLSIVHAAHAQAVFSGTWRPDPQRPDATAPPDVQELANGTYECRSCEPPYKIKADGSDQPISNNPRYDSLSVSVVDGRTLLKIARKGSAIVFQSRTVVARDGKSRTEVQTVSSMPPRPFEMAIESVRVAPGSSGSHAISGTWRVIKADLVHHDEDTTYKVNGDTLTMTDRFGRTFAAKLDGTDAPYKGDRRFTNVSVKLLDSRTIEEIDKLGPQPVQITRWSVDPDGKTMHVRFDDTHGFVQEQTGHKLR